MRVTEGGKSNGHFINKYKNQITLMSVIFLAIALISNLLEFDTMKNVALLAATFVASVPIYKFRKDSFRLGIETIL